MLYLVREFGESLKIGDYVSVKILGINTYGEVRIGIEAPLEITVIVQKSLTKEKRVNLPF